jgi:hypothetical protein
MQIFLQYESARRVNRHMHMAFDFKEKFRRSENFSLSWHIGTDRSIFVVSHSAPLPT